MEEKILEGAHFLSKTRVILRLVISLTLLFCNLGFADQHELKARMKGDLDILKNTFQTQYAPIEWKESFSGWSLNREIEEAKILVDSSPDITVKDYQVILKKFVNSLQDFHVSISFYSTEYSELPFSIGSANHKYFITAVFRNKLPSSASALQVGDEIIRIDGKPIRDVIQQFQNGEFAPDSLANQGFAEVFYTSRIGAVGHIVPKDKISLEVKHKRTGKTAIYQIPWDYEPELVQNIIPFMKATHQFSAKAKTLTKTAAGATPRVPLNQHECFKKGMMMPHFEYYKKTNGSIQGHGIGAKLSPLPLLGKKIWQATSQCQFYAYIFETPDQHRYGYVRIPHYDGSSAHASEFSDLIKKFQKETEALIIDQLDNPGGSVFYMYALLSKLTDRPLAVPKHRVSLTQKEIYYAFDVLMALEAVKTDDDAKEIIGDDFEGLPVTIQLAKQWETYFRFTIDQWNAGKNFTDPISIYGVDEVLPDPAVRYTKPILVLINHLDFSCGDFLPAILQDNHRATLFGSRTAGAGGFVLSSVYPNLFGIEKITYTGSIAERSENRVIENLGVTPDIPYELVEADLTDNYSTYVSALLKALKKL